MLLHQYNLFGCWVLTIGLAAGRIYGKIELEWWQILLPVLAINGWFLLVGLWSRIGRIMAP